MYFELYSIIFLSNPFIVVYYSRVIEYFTAAFKFAYTTERDKDGWDSKSKCYVRVFSSQF